MASEEMDDAKTQPMPPEDYPVERTDEEVALETITWEARSHFGRTHLDDWMELQRKAHSRYWSVGSSDVPNCKICLAYAAALEALAEPDEEEPDV